MASSPAKQKNQIDRMAGKYTFPYHHLASKDGSVWRIERHLNWGFEYLGYLQAVVDEICAVGGPVLEIGCGDGRLASELVRVNVEPITAIDIDERAVLLARAMNGEATVSFRAQDVRVLEESQFNVAVAMEVMEHIPDQDLGAVIDAIADRLAPRGKLVITVPTVNVPVTPAHFRHYDLATLKNHIGKRFVVEKTKYLHRPGVTAGLIRRLLVNRFFVLNERHMLDWLAHLYRARVLHADESNGAHLLVVARRKDD